MITPTRTVCYAIPVNSKEMFVVNSVMVNGVLIELQQRPMKLHYLCYSEVDHLVVREEPVKKEEGPKHPWCNKHFNPMFPCGCGDCDSVLSSYSFMRPIPMPQYNYQKMYQGEWHDEK